MAAVLEGTYELCWPGISLLDAAHYPHYDGTVHTALTSLYSLRPQLISTRHAAGAKF